MHGEEEKAGSCRGAVEITVPIIITACFLNTVACFPLPTLVPHFLFRERGVASAGKMTDFRVGRCK